jgi:hypothetical protein
MVNIDSEMGSTGHLATAVLTRASGERGHVGAAHSHDESHHHSF